MKSLNKRLDNLDDQLSPTEIVLRGLHEVAHLGSPREFAAHLKNSPKSDWPVNRITRQARQAAIESTRGKPQPTIEKTIKDWHRNVMFLWSLHLELTSRIFHELDGLTPVMDRLAMELRSRLLLDDHRFNATSAWRHACRDLPYPLDAETAAAVEAALEHQVEPWDNLRDPDAIEQSVLEETQNEDDHQHSEWDASDEEVAGIARRLERAIRRMVRSKTIEAGKLALLPTVPLPFLDCAPLLEGRWIDATILELAELGVILADRGYSMRGSGDAHPLAWEQFVRADAEGDVSPIGDASWNEARQAATDRVCAYRGKRRRFGGRDYVNLSLYQKWRATRRRARLEASTESGFVVRSWNAWGRRQHEPALAGVRVRPLERFVNADTWTVHDSASARRLQSARTNLLSHLGSSEMGEQSSAAPGALTDDVVASWRDSAGNALIQVDGLAAAMHNIRSTYFENHEIVYPEVAQNLDRFRTAIRKFFEVFDEHPDRHDPLPEGLTRRTLPAGGDAAPDRQCSVPQEVGERIAQTGAQIVRDLVRHARFQALVSIREQDAAEKMIDEDLDSLF